MIPGSVGIEREPRRQGGELTVYSVMTPPLLEATFGTMGVSIV